MQSCSYDKLNYTRIYTNFDWFLVMSFFEETRKDNVNTDKSFLSLFGVCIIKKKTESSLPWVCIVIDHRICLNALTL